jgi:hypothetical protein
MANCTHPAICNGVCLVCHENIAEKPHTQAVNVIDNPADKPPEKAQEKKKRGGRRGE